MNVAAGTGGVFGVAALEEEEGFFVTFLAKVVEQAWVGAGRELGGEVFETGEEREQVRLWIGGGHGFHGLLQLDERLEDCGLGFGHDIWIT